MSAELLVLLVPFGILVALVWKLWPGLRRLPGDSQRDARALRDAARETAADVRAVRGSYRAARAQGASAATALARAAADLDAAHPERRGDGREVSPLAPRRLPRALRAAVAATLPGGNVLEASRVEQRGRSPWYELTVEQDGRRWWLDLDASGNVLERSEDDGDGESDEVDADERGGVPGSPAPRR